MVTEEPPLHAVLRPPPPRPQSLDWAARSDAQRATGFKLQVVVIAAWLIYVAFHHLHH